MSIPISMRIAISARLYFVDGDQSESFGDWMKRLRESKGLNQSQLASAMSWAQSEISRTESSQREPTADFVVAFAAAIEIDVREALLKAGYPVRLDNGLEEMLGDAKAAIEIARLLVSIKDDDARDMALANIRAILTTSAARAEAHKAKRGDSGTTTGRKAAGHAPASG